MWMPLPAAQNRRNPLVTVVVQLSAVAKSEIVRRMTLKLPARITINVALCKMYGFELILCSIRTINNCDRLLEQDPNLNQTDCAGVTTTVTCALPNVRRSNYSALSDSDSARVDVHNDPNQSCMHKYEPSLLAGGHCIEPQMEKPESGLDRNRVWHP